jgi:hypothetical protein
MNPPAIVSGYPSRSVSWRATSGATWARIGPLHVPEDVHGLVRFHRRDELGSALRGSVAEDVLDPFRLHLLERIRDRPWIQGGRQLIAGRLVKLLEEIGEFAWVEPPQTLVGDLQPQL